jgi:hypothetical protein
MSQLLVHGYLFGWQLVGRGTTASAHKAEKFAVTMDGTRDLTGKIRESNCICYVDEDVDPVRNLYDWSNNRCLPTSRTTSPTAIPIEQLRGQT